MGARVPRAFATRSTLVGSVQHVFRLSRSCALGIEAALGDPQRGPGRNREYRRAACAISRIQHERRGQLARPFGREVSWRQGVGWRRLAIRHFEPAELDILLHRSARILDVRLTDDGATEIAGRSRGTPRIANRLLRRVRDFAEVRADGEVNSATARAALRVYDVDDLGLDRLDKAVLTALVKSFGGGPVGLSTLAVAVGEQPDTVEEVCEPYLVRAGLLARTPRGRVATAGAWRHLGLAPPARLPLPDTMGSGATTVPDLFTQDS